MATMLADLTSSMLGIHRAWAWVVVIANGAVGVWGVAAHRFLRLRGRPFWGGVVVAQSAIVVQVALGAAVFAGGERPPTLHVFYGVLLVVFPTLLWVYRSEPAFRRRTYLYYGLASLFFMGLAIRAMLKAG